MIDDLVHDFDGVENYPERLPDPEWITDMDEDFLKKTAILRKWLNSVGVNTTDLLEELRYWVSYFGGSPRGDDREAGEVRAILSEHRGREVRIHFKDGRVRVGKPQRIIPLQMGRTIHNVVLFGADSVGDKGGYAVDPYSVAKIEVSDWVTLYPKED